MGEADSDFLERLHAAAHEMQSERAAAVREATATGSIVPRAVSDAGIPVASPPHRSTPFWDSSLPRPGWRSSLLAGVLGPAVAVAATATFVLLVLLIVVRPGAHPTLDQLREIGTRPHWYWAGIAAFQLTLGGVTWIFASRSRAPWRVRIGLRRPIIGFGTLPLMLLSCFAINGVAGLLISALQTAGWLPPIGADRLDLPRVLAETPREWLFIVLLVVAILPAMIEESLFRGFVLTGLLVRWPSWAALLASSVLFAASHLDVAYAVAMLPLGVWLGYIAWRTRSIVHGAVCHAVVNAVPATVLMTTRTLPPPPSSMTPGMVWAMLAIMTVFAFILALTCVVSIERSVRRWRPATLTIPPAVEPGAGAPEISPG